jgi:hypothetical protein
MAMGVAQDGLGHSQKGVLAMGDRAKESKASQEFDSREARWPSQPEPMGMSNWPAAARFLFIFFLTLIALAEVTMVVWSFYW